MSAEQKEAVIEISGLHKEYRGEGETIHVLEDLSLRVAAGEIISVEGASGVGKSTLLNIIGTIDQATSGTLKIAGFEIAEMSTRQREMFRAQTLGFIFQHHYLLPDFTLQENVMMPLLIQRRPLGEARQQADHALELVGLTGRRKHFPNQVSGGELARADVARALVGGKSLILADEPTGNLDRANSEHLADLLWQLQSELSFTLMIVTHDRDLASRVPVRYRLLDGKLGEYNGVS